MLIVRQSQSLYLYIPIQTSNSTLWTLYLLAITPAVQESIYQEIYQILPDKAEIIQLQSSYNMGVYRICKSGVRNFMVLNIYG